MAQIQFSRTSPLERFVSGVQQGQKIDADREAAANDALYRKAAEERAQKGLDLQEREYSAAENRRKAEADLAKQLRQREDALKGVSFDPTGGLVVQKGGMYDLEKQSKLADIMKKKAEAGEKASPLKKFTDAQNTAGGYARRLEQAEADFNKLSESGYDRTKTGEGLRSMLAGIVPQAKSAQSGQQEQAERNFVTAVLRKESGAAISPSEYENAAKQYFPRVGDTPEVLAQKAANRAQVIEGMRASSGGAVENIPLIRSGAASTKKNTGGKPRAVVQDGMTFILNEATGEYEYQAKI